MLDQVVTLFFVFLMSRVAGILLLALAAYYCLKGNIKGVAIVGLIFTLTMTFTTIAHRWQTFGLCIFIFIVATVLTMFVKESGIGWKDTHRILEK